MTFRHGKNAAIWVDGADLSTYFKSAAFSVFAERDESTTFQSSWRNYVEGVAFGRYDLFGLYDPTMHTIRDLLPVTSSIVSVMPSGYALGDMARLVEADSARYAETAPVGGVVGMNWNVLAKSRIGFGRVIGALAAVTGDGNGTAVDLTAQSTSGAIAQLHVTSVSASDSIVVTIEDSSTGSSNWATVGTFASRSAAGAERITIAGTIKRFVRVVDDVTGTDVSITRGVTFART